MSFMTGVLHVITQVLCHNFTFIGVTTFHFWNEIFRKNVIFIIKHNHHIRHMLIRSLEKAEVDALLNNFFKRDP
jgi:hypothetical protein